MCMYMYMYIHVCMYRCTCICICLCLCFCRFICVCVYVCVYVYIYVYKTWGTTHALRFYCCAEVSHVGLLGSMHLAAQKTHQGEHMPQRNKAWLVPDGVLQREPENAQITAFEMVKHVYIYICICVYRFG